MKTLEEARAYVEEHRVRGINCPCCDRYVRAYRRRLNEPMVETLVLILAAWEATHADVYVETLVQDREDGASLRADFGKLRYWLLLEKGNRSGFWRPTPRAVEFIRRGLPVPAWVLVEQDRVLAMATDLVTFAELRPDLQREKGGADDAT